MLVIRDTQVDTFRGMLRQRFEDELTSVVMATYPGACRQAGGREQVGMLVRRGVAEAASKAYSSRRQASVYVSLMLMLGTDFADDPQLPWVADYLGAQSIADPTMRLEQLFAAALDYLGATAGEDGEWIAGALTRMRAFELSAAPGRTGEGWISDVAAILKQFYPEKYHHQGDTAMRRMIWIGARRARQAGLAERHGVFVFVSLMFMLGSGFDRDPLFPWAARVLNDAAHGSETARAARLYAEGLAHIEQSLGD